jgi:hypothetical protein
MLSKCKNLALRFEVPNQNALIMRCRCQPCSTMRERAVENLYDWYSASVQRRLEIGSLGSPTYTMSVSV